MIPFNPCRYQLLEYLIAGLKKTGCLLIEYDGNSIAPIFTVNNSVDDIGMFLIVPQLAYYFNLTINSAINLFFYGLLGMGTALGLLGLFLIFRNNFIYCAMSAISLVCCATFCAFLVRDIYLIYGVVIISLLPITFFFIEKASGSYLFYFWSFLMAIICGSMHICRSYSSFGVAVWFLLSVFLMPQFKMTFSRKTIISMIFFIALLIPFFYAKNIERKSTKYLISNLPSYTPTPHIHPHWHSFYLGFGFLEFLNKTGISWNDGWAFDQAREIVPNIDQNDVRYDQIIKGFTLNFIKNNLVFVLVTLWSKIGLLFYYLLRYLHISLFFIFRKTTLHEIVPFLGGLCCYALFPLLTIPADIFSLGFIVFAYVSSLIIFFRYLAAEPLNLKNKVISFIFVICSIINSQPNKLLLLLPFGSMIVGFAFIVMLLTRILSKRGVIATR